MIIWKLEQGFFRELALSLDPYKSSKLQAPAGKPQPRAQRHRAIQYFVGPYSLAVAHARLHATGKWPYWNERSIRGSSSADPTELRQRQANQPKGQHR